MVAALTRERVRQTMMASVGCGKLTDWASVYCTFTFLVPGPSFSPSPLFPVGGLSFSVPLTVERPGYPS